jgi:4a-hydroxytetrahydrobiopterin dehydratase
MALAEKRCEPCHSGGTPLPPEETRELAKETPAWTLKEKAIEREFRFPDFRQAMDFVNRVAAVANAEDHHPDIHISYGTVRLELSTHKIGGLSQNDFIVAAKIDALL